MPAATKLSNPARFELSALHLLSTTEEFVERFAAIGVFAVLLIFVLWAVLASRGIRLQFDELLEIAASSAPTSRQVLSSLASGVDFNPPFSHFLIRLSTSLWGDTELAARLPALVGVGVLLICLYTIVSEQMTRGYGLVAMLLIVCLPIRDYAVEARPYGVELGLSGIAILLYRRAVQGRHRVLSLVGLAVATAALVATHYYAILVVGALLAAELVRSWKSKRLDWPLLACCLGPPTVVLLALRDVVAQQRQQLTHYFARGNLLSFDHGYEGLAIDPLISCVALILIVAVVSMRWGKGDPLYAHSTPVNPPLVEIALGVGLLLLPVVGAVFTQFVTHAYVPRYFLPAAIGLAICFCYTARLFSVFVPGLVVLLMIPLSLGFGKAVLQEVIRTPEALPSITDLTAEGTPLLFDTPAAYLQVYHYFPGLRDKLWVIVDPAASLRHRGYDTDDKIMFALTQQSRAQAISLSTAGRRWPSFRLVPRSGDYVWALKCVMEAGSQIQVRNAFGSSNYIFDVSVPAGRMAQIDACTSPTR
jgi:hypothetical protein